MAGVDGGSTRPPVRDPAEARLLLRLRALAIGVFLVLVCIVVLAVVAGRQVGDVFFATLIGALLAMFGIETIARFSGGR